MAGAESDGNEELFRLYDTELVLRLQNPKNRNDTKKTLVKFKAYLDERSPTPELAKSFLTQYANRKLNCSVEVTIAVLLPELSESGEPQMPNHFHGSRPFDSRRRNIGKSQV